ncbi:synaptotagmin-14-like isoform X3 [Tachypleus tridentatus]|uniref:synaptotagmin-14-like isoform X3 n=1 Tax=Tachypleus tridentatus TaxID=6853 RepID=UPI003FD3E19B
MLSVPSEAVAFLGVVCVLSLLVVCYLYIYLKNKLCFSGENDNSYYNDLEKEKIVGKNLGLASSDDYSSTDSEDEVFQIIQKSASFQILSQRAASNHGISETEKSNKLCHLQEQATTIAMTEESDGSEKKDVNLLIDKEQHEKVASDYSVTDGTMEQCSEATNDLYQFLLKNGAFQKCEDSLSKDNQAVSIVEDPLFNQEDSLSKHNLQGKTTDHDQGQITQCGMLEVSFRYDSEAKSFVVNVLQIHELPSKERGSPSYFQLRLVLLPHKRQKHKSRIMHITETYVRETYTFNRINTEDLSIMGIRFLLFGFERMRREHLFGETIVSLASQQLNEETTVILKLEPRANLAQVDSTTDVSSPVHSDSVETTKFIRGSICPELLLGLTYNSTTGCLVVEVLRGKHFHNISLNKIQDTYVKLTFNSSNGQEISKSKTSVQRGDSNPVFKETFVFRVALFQLPDVTLIVSVYNKHNLKRDEMIGWFSLGLYSSGDKELSHWKDVQESKGKQNQL